MTFQLKDKVTGAIEQEFEAVNMDKAIELVRSAFSTAWRSLFELEAK